MDEAKRPRTEGVPVCGIGASAGGVEALQQFFGALPGDLGLAYVVILHLAPDRKSELPHILARWTPMPVRQVGDHDRAPIAPDHVYVIAPDRQLVISDSTVGAVRFDRPQGPRVAIDLFFRSLAASRGDGFAVLLSGTGSDGSLGAKAVKERGGLVLVQDPGDAAHGGMPSAAIASGVADVVLPARELALHLADLVRTGGGAQAFVRGSEVGEPAAEEEKALRGVLDVLRRRTGHDFSKYKRTTVLRRLSRRVQLARRVTIAQYLKHLRADDAEVRALLNDLLISVTTFFRDPAAWTALAAQVIAPLVAGSAWDQPLRAWVAGCATGEEAYSLAILLQEAFEGAGLHPHFTVFASDVDEGGLALAREGLYPQAIAADVSEPRLQRFFRRDENHLRVVSALRDHVVFATHDLLRDPPFAKLHLVSCRNLLIYLDRDLQEQVLDVFRYACRDDAFLFLGASEEADEEVFEPVDKRHRIYRVRARAGEARPRLPDMLTAPSARLKAGREERVPSRPMGAEVHAAALEEVAPPSVLVDMRWNVLHLSPSASRFFGQAAGPLARRLTDSVRPELREEVYAVLQHAVERPSPQLTPFVSVAFNGAPHKVAALAQQHVHKEDGSRQVLVTFLDAGEAPPEASAGEPQPESTAVRDLRQRLREAERRVETMRDDHHLTMEDLRAANEELQSLNEEYRSTTEELETSKEELQSMNEELHTVNHELAIKLEEVSRANSDLENLMAATNVATVFLTPDLHIKRFTPTLTEIFKIQPRDRGRAIGDLKRTLDYDVEEDARRVLATQESIDREARSGDGHVYVVRLGPYRTEGGRKIDGVVATFIDITALKAAEAALRQSERQLEAELDVMRRLHAMTLEVATAADRRSALVHVLNAAVELQGAQFGCVQLVGHESTQLETVVQQGFEPGVLDRFLPLTEEGTAWARALATRTLVQIPDVNAEAPGPDRAGAARAGYRAVQSAPLITRNGDLVGVLSVHFREPHPFSPRDGQLADLVARQAADLVDSLSQRESLRELNEALRRRTEELEASERQLTRQAVELRAQDRHREEFLASLGHELRNPMAAMQGSLHFLSASDDRSRRALAVMKRQMQHMTRLVNDLLDVTRVRHGLVRLKREPTDVTQAVHAALDMVRERAERKTLMLACDGPPRPVVVDADPERLAQILDNLLQNALTYTDAGEILVTVTREETSARVTVRDSGMGIAPQDLPGLFEPYRRVVADEQRNRALGLGLTLVKALVEAHGGSVEARSEGPGTGSEFRFTLPLAGVARPEPADRDAPVGPLPRRRILVVDDSRDVADMFATLLETLGQDVQVAYDGASALTLAARHSPDVVFLDVTMPGMDGPEVARRLRDGVLPAGAVVVAVTGHDKTYPFVKNGAFDHHLMKPVSEEELVAFLRDLPTE